MVIEPDKPASGATASLGSITIDNPVAKRISRAEIALAKADVRARYFEFSEALNDMLATLDALAMANVANIRVTFDDVYDKQWVRTDGNEWQHRTRDEALVGKVLAYKKSVLHITDVVTPGFRISEPRITLMYQFLDGRGSEATPGQPRHVHGTYRTGAAPTRSSRNESCESAHSADAGEIPTLMRRLVAFCNTDRFSPTVQSAIALALFEAISPFDYHIDHMGRLLARAVLCRRGLIEHLACPLALHASKHRRGHYTLLEALDENDVRRGAMPKLVVGFLNSHLSEIMEGVKVSLWAMDAIEGLELSWRERMDSPRADSAVRAILDILPELPRFTLASMITRTGRSKSAVNAAIDQLELAGIVRRDGPARRNRVFVVPEMGALFTALRDRILPKGSATKAQGDAIPSVFRL